MDTEPDVATLCRQGKHQLVLVEEIGLKCTCCSLVQVEIKDIMPSFVSLRFILINISILNSVYL